jgi:hypothetical protein
VLGGTHSTVGSNPTGTATEDPVDPSDYGVFCSADALKPHENPTTD